MFDMDLTENDEYDSEERKARIKAIVRRVIQEELTETQREVFMMYHFKKMTIPEIAKKRGVHKSTISRTLYRAEVEVHRILKYFV